MAPCTELIQHLPLMGFIRHTLLKNDKEVKYTGHWECVDVSEFASFSFSVL